MIKKYKIPTNEQLIKVASYMDSELSDIDKTNISIVVELNSDQLRQVDEEYFFKYNKNAKPEEFIPGNEVELIISNIKVKFVEKEQ